MRPFDDPHHVAVELGLEGVLADLHELGDPLYQAGDTSGGILGDQGEALLRIILGETGEFSEYRCQEKAGEQEDQRCRGGQQPVLESDIQPHGLHP